MGASHLFKTKRTMTDERATGVNNVTDIFYNCVRRNVDFPHYFSSTSNSSRLATVYPPTHNVGCCNGGQTSNEQVYLYRVWPQFWWGLLPCDRERRKIQGRAMFLKAMRMYSFLNLYPYTESWKSNNVEHFLILELPMRSANERRAEGPLSELISRTK